MISVCIPIYNCRVAILLRELRSLIRASGVKAEISLIDDRSADEYREYNRHVCREHKYILLENNIGRSRIRNLFLKHAEFPYLLFLDCDSIINSPDFLNNYVSELRKTGSPVICGGLANETSVPSRKERLRWKYGISREENPAPLRNLDPYGFFRTNNFITDRNVLENIGFDERISGYGYEDTLFAYRLMKGDITVTHIDNPVLHCCRESNREFLDKSKNGVANLVAIMEYIDYDKEFINGIRLLRTHLKLRQWRLLSILTLLSGITQPGLEILLARGYGGLWMLDLYKLGVLLRTGRIKKKRLPF
jgi:glycosyltransferase involved in cell wall biosynthesis